MASEAVDPDRAGRVAGRLVVEISSGPLVPAATADLVVVPAHEYRVVPDAVLLRDNQMLTPGTSDRQVAFFIDANRDKVEQAGELISAGAVGGPTAVLGGARPARCVRFESIPL